MPGRVQDTQELHGIGGDAVTDQKRKTLQLQAAYASLTFRPALWRGHDEFDRSFGEVDKLAPLPGALSFVITGGGNQVGLKLGVIPSVHPSEARALRKTSLCDLG